MNDARMTIRLPGDTLLFAQRYAKKRQISLSELVVRYFNRLKETFSREDEVPASVSEETDYEKEKNRLGDQYCVGHLSYDSLQQDTHSGRTGRK